jgi:hypothetical protein
MSTSDDGRWSYTDEEWPDCAPGRPLESLELAQVMLLHRHWIWAKTQQEIYNDELRAGRPPDINAMAHVAVSSLFLWYALLWSVLDAIEDRGVKFGGRLDADIASLSDGLRRCRNAVFHVSRDAYYDDRLFAFMADAESAPKLRRITAGLGRLFLAEFDEREL